MRHIGVTDYIGLANATYRHNLGALQSVYSGDNLFIEFIIFAILNMP